MKFIKTIIASSMVLLSTANAFADTQTTKYLIFVENGKQASEQIVQRDDQGLTKVRFIFKDNGRGPELNEEFRLGADGLIKEYKVTGNSTFGAVVNESYQRTGDQAEWKSTSEQGKKNRQRLCFIYSTQ